MLIAFLALDNVLLLSFLGQPLLPVVAIALIGPALLGLITYKLTPGQ